MRKKRWEGRERGGGSKRSLASSLLSNKDSKFSCFCHARLLLVSRPFLSDSSTIVNTCSPLNIFQYYLSCVSDIIFNRCFLLKLNCAIFVNKKTDSRALDKLCRGYSYFIIH